MNLPQKLKNNIYIDPIKDLYKYTEYIKITEVRLICPIYFIYYIFTWDLVLKYKQYIYFESGKNYKTNVLYPNGIYKYIYVLPFYNNYFFYICNERFYIHNGNNNLCDFNIKRKKLLNDLYKIINSIVNINKLEFKDYTIQFINSIEAYNFLEQKV